jgi:hypothetical protein
MDKNFQKKIFDFIRKKSIKKFFNKVEKIVNDVIKKWMSEICNTTI